jgi:putative flippase GtrA
VNNTSTFARWMKFNAVGAIRIFIQLGTLALLKSVLGVNYLVSTALAVEATVLHNFFWHQWFTWKDRPSTETLHRLLKFNLGNGAISVIGNLMLMNLLVGAVRLHYLVANLICITACSLANFIAGDRWVFAARVPR